MKRLFGFTIGFTALGLSLVAADDFGDLLKRGLKDSLKDQLSAKHIKETLAPHDLNADMYSVQTEDGWTLVAHRYRTTGPRRAAAMPVILCHGLSYNALFWDLDPATSLPLYLSQLGYDVWSVSLRGCGMSQKWVWKLDNAPTVLVGGAIRKLSGGRVKPTGYATVDPKYADWTMDDHIAHDVPAFVQLVRQETGARQVAWVGHSMGGIIALAQLTRYENPGIGRLVTVGSQFTMPHGQLFVEFAYEMLRTRQRELSGGPVDKKKLAEATKKSVNNMFFKERHTSPKVYEALTTYANDFPAISLLKQYLVLAETGQLWDAPRQYNYAERASNMRVPVLISCGEADQLAGPDVQHFLYDHVGATEKKLVVFGRSQGFTANAGHNDSLVGNTCRAEIYPVIERWLREQK
jgi:pimeloyl-ACP methyl ester carboxylesterase